MAVERYFKGLRVGGRAGERAGGRAGGRAGRQIPRCGAPDPIAAAIVTSRGAGRLARPWRGSGRGSEGRRGAARTCALAAAARPVAAAIAGPSPHYSGLPSPPIPCAACSRPQIVDIHITRHRDTGKAKACFVEFDSQVRAGTPQLDWVQAGTQSWGMGGSISRGTLLRTLWQGRPSSYPTPCQLEVPPGHAETRGASRASGRAALPL